MSSETNPADHLKHYTINKKSFLNTGNVIKNNSHDYRLDMKLTNTRNGKVNKDVPANTPNYQVGDNVYIKESQLKDKLPN